jgi:hypothetical protein
MSLWNFEFEFEFLEFEVMQETTGLGGEKGLTT